MRNRLFITGAIVAVLALCVGMTASATPIGGFVSTDRFGYTGTVQRYASLQDAQNGTNSIDTISVGDRDLALSLADNDTTIADENIMMGSWWYTLDTHFSATQGRAGWGNTRGNTGVGFMQLYDWDGSTDSTVSMEFTDFDGTYYTAFDLLVQGGNATRTDDYARLSAYDNVNDGGTWHEYTLDLTATGLQGVDLGGVIESTNQPTGVTGSFTGIFEITENQTSPANQGFYTIDFTLTMTNWAWSNRWGLTSEVSSDGGNSFFDGRFADSTFRTVQAPIPEPATISLLGLGLAGLAARRIRRKK